MKISETCTGFHTVYPDVPIVRLHTKTTEEVVKATEEEGKEV